MPLRQLAQAVLDDIAKVCPQQLEQHRKRFSTLLAGHYCSDYLLEYLPGPTPYQLNAYERGQAVGGIRSSSIDDFRFDYIATELGTPCSSKQQQLECIITRLHMVFGPCERLNTFIRENEWGVYSKRDSGFKLCEAGIFSTFDLSTMTFRSMPHEYYVAMDHSNGEKPSPSGLRTMCLLAKGVMTAIRAIRPDCLPMHEERCLHWAAGYEYDGMRLTFRHTGPFGAGRYLLTRSENGQAVPLIDEPSLELFIRSYATLEGLG